MTKTSPSLSCGLALIFCLLAPGPALSQQEAAGAEPRSEQERAALAPAPDALWVVGIVEEPPYAIRGEGGGWDGLGPELWADIAAARAIRYRWRAYETAREALAALERGEVAAVVGAEMTPQGEGSVDYTPPFLRSPIGLARAEEAGIVPTLKAFLSPTFGKIAAAVALLLLLVGALVWAAERRSNEEQFEREARPGLWSGFWWACVTMTTIGYGDKAPESVAGRVIAMLWMVLAMGVTASITASLTTAMSEQDTSIDEVEMPDGLRSHEIGALRGSRAAAYLDEHAVAYRPFEDLEAGGRAADSGEIDLLVHDFAGLRYAQQQVWEKDSMRIRPTWVRAYPVAIALPQDSEEREPLAREVLRLTSVPAWRSTERRYMASAQGES